MMQHYTPTDDQIRTQFVTSLMNYFKIEEDIFLRSHIDELLRPISVTKYSEFLHQLSTRNLPFKTGIEKIAIIAGEFVTEQLSPLENEAIERSGKLYALMYDLRRSITEERNGDQSALERFENVRFSSIKRSDSSQNLLDEIDIELIRRITKKWIYDYVSLDRGLFEAKVRHEYLQLLIERQRQEKQPHISARTQKALKSR